MHKPVSLLLFFFAVSLCLIVSSDVATQPPLIYEDEGVISVDLDKTKVTLACPWGNRSKSSFCQEDERKIAISTISPSAAKNGWTYYYLVTGGKIIGEGANVVWDFTGAKSGDYSITVGVGKNGVVKESLMTKMIMAYSCECHMPCSCSSISVLGPETYTKRGDALIFTAKVEGGKQDKITYNWKVSSGTIIVGQGTKQILVRTDKNSEAEIITATLEVDGQECFECPREFSTSTQFTER